MCVCVCQVAAAGGLRQAVVTAGDKLPQGYKLERKVGVRLAVAAMHVAAACLRLTAAVPHVTGVSPRQSRKTALLNMHTPSLKPVVVRASWPA